MVWIEITPPFGDNPLAGDSAFWERELSHFSPPGGQQIVFIDSAVPDCESLIGGVQPGVEVIILDSGRDGVEQIGEILSHRSDIAALHIVSHGSPGALQLGNAALNSANLAETQKWANALTPDADILIYGCEVAAGGVTGEPTDFIERLAEYTGADVAASDDKTGSALLGGDWLLECATGKIDSPLAFKIGAMAGYDRILAAPPIVVNEFRRSTGDITGNEYIELLLTRDLTAAELETYVVGDSTATTAQKYSAYRFTNMAGIAPTFKAGTLIAIGGDPALQETAYNPIPTGTDSDWNLILSWLR